MACYHPLKGFIIGKTKTGKDDIKVVPYGVHHLERQRGKWIYADDEFVSSYSDRVYRDWIQIPCGKCIGCRLQYSKEWADRCLMELQYHDSAYFLTLTYDDEHLPFPDYVDDDLKVTYLDDQTGECGVLPTLQKRDIQLFHKRLRERTGQKIRYFIAGEYGDHTLRPHYHSIEFGLEIPDKQVYTIRNGYTLWTSDFINEIWQKGHVIIGNVTWETCAYTARYVVKKLNGYLRSYYDSHNISPEFVLMSRKPGLGYQYFADKNCELYFFRDAYVKTATGSKRVSPTNKYFDRLFELSEPDKLAEVKSRRIEAAKHTELLRNAQTSNNFLDRLLAEEENKLAQTKSLKRLDC